MKIYLLPFLLLPFLPGLLNAQLTVSGKVINDATELPIGGASVYINNTSAGTISNSSGEFSFTVSNVSQGDMIVSSVGFEVLAVKVSMQAGHSKKFLCRLVVKQQDLKEVLVVSDRTRQRWLAMFKENFLGVTQEANTCDLRNLDAIYFTKSADSHPNSFNAYCDTPLVIINKMLGYKISFQLIEFSFDEGSGGTYYYGYTRFEEIGEKKRYFRNRENAYYGSTFHFYRSLIANRLADEGYLAYTLKKVTINNNNSGGKQGNSGPSSGQAESFSAAVPVTAAGLVQEDSTRQGFFKITAGDKLMVQYKKDPASRRYLSSRVMLMDALPVGVRSYITSLVPFFFIDKNGIAEDPLSVRYSGYWFYEKAANMLPYDYQPGILPTAAPDKKEN